MIALLLAAGIITRRYLFVWENVAHYKAFTKVRGIPQGIGSLTLEQVRRRPWSIRIVKSGRWGLVRRMEAVDSRERLTARHTIGTYLSQSQSNRRKPARWEFEYDARGRVAHELAYDQYGQRVWAFVYSPTEGGENVRI